MNSASPERLRPRRSGEHEETAMRKVIVNEWMTLDGVIQAPGGDREDTDGGFAFKAMSPKP
jgi:hypothetical protein